MARPLPTGDKQLILTSVKLEKGLLDKLAYVTWFDRKASKKATISEALADYFTKWERKNGAITEAHIAHMNKALGIDK